MHLSSEAEQLRLRLRERLEIISDRDWYRRDPEGHLKALAGVSEGIDRLSSAVSHEAGVSPELKHYLGKRSFEKALKWLETGSAVDE